jgi:hypothetical protein
MFRKRSHLPPFSSVLWRYLDAKGVTKGVGRRRSAASHSPTSGAHQRLGDVRRFATRSSARDRKLATALAATSTGTPLHHQGAHPRQFHWVFESDLHESAECTLTPQPQEPQLGQTKVDLPLAIGHTQASRSAPKTRSNHPGERSTDSVTKSSQSFSRITGKRSPQAHRYTPHMLSQSLQWHSKQSYRSICLSEAPEAPQVGQVQMDA